MSGGSPALLVAENGRDYNVAKTHPTTPVGIVSSQGGRQISKSNVVGWSRPGRSAPQGV